jgi:hypothetical protein
MTKFSAIGRQLIDTAAPLTHACWHWFARSIGVEVEAQGELPVVTKRIAWYVTRAAKQRVEPDV